MKIHAQRVLLPEGFAYDRTITVENGRITGITAGGQGDVTCHTAVPGLIDEHVHGGLGADVMNGTPEQLLAWLRFLLQNGVTQVLAGVYTSPVETIRHALANLRTVMDMQRLGAGGALLTGVHLEGPFISMDALGAMQGEYVLPPTVENYRMLTEGYEDMIRLVTLSPETTGAGTLIDELNRQGIPVIAGHTAATAEEGRAAFEAGVRGVCHFFNASTPIHHRKPGILTEALLDDRVYCECICDFVHVHPSAVRLIWKNKGAARMIVVSDAVSTTGLPDGVYEDNGIQVRVSHGESRTLDGHLNGGGSTAIEEVRNLISIGIPEADAFVMASATPARHLRVEGGAIQPGARAEIVCLDEENRVLCTVLGARVEKGGRA